MRCFLFLIAFIISTNLVLAQEVSISKYPESPKEGETVTLRVESSIYDLTKATIMWSVDGIVTDTGVGRVTLSEKAPFGGTKVVVVIVSQEGLPDIPAQTFITANTNYILYEGADSYVPPFYKGRRLPAQESTVRALLLSFDNNQLVGLNKRNNDLISWFIDGEEKKELAGQGNVLSLLKPSITSKSMTLRVKATKSSGDAVTSDSAIPLQSTETVLYKTDENNLVQSPLSQNETGNNIYISVEPFFYSVKNKRDSELTYNWKINDTETKIDGPWFVKFAGSEKKTFQIILNLIQNKKLTQENQVGFVLKTN